MATISYSFAIADVSPLADPPWTAEYSGSLKIVSNQATAINFGGRQGNTWNADSFGDDQYAEVTIGTGSGTWGYESWVACRLNASAEGYVVYFGQGFATINIGTIGSAGNITNLQNTGVTGSPGDVIKIEAVGTSIKAFKNGAQAGTTETSSLFTSGQIGLGGTFVGYDVFTLFAGGDVSGPAFVMRTFERLSEPVMHPKIAIPYQ